MHPYPNTDGRIRVLIASDDSSISAELMDEYFTQPPPPPRALFRCRHCGRETPLGLTCQACLDAMERQPPGYGLGWIGLVLFVVAGIGVAAWFGWKLVAGVIG